MSKKRRSRKIVNKTKILLAITGHYNPVFRLSYSVNHLKNSKISSSHWLNIYLIQSNIQYVAKFIDIPSHSL